MLLSKTANSSVPFKQDLNITELSLLSLLNGLSLKADKKSFKLKLSSVFSSNVEPCIALPCPYNNKS